MSNLTAVRVHGNSKDSPAKIVFTGSKICGSGRFSNVYSTMMIVPEEMRVAIKNVWSTTEDARMQTEDCAEVQILSKLYHPAIANLLYYFTRDGDTESQKLHCLVLDFMPADMAKLRESGVKFDVLDAKVYSYQLFSAIAYLSSKNVVHMDVKPNNIVINHETGLLKLADFGNARRLDSEERRGPSYQVTRFYRPPELLFGCEHFTCAIDVWSVACVSFEFIANSTLFKARSTADQISLLIDVFGYPSDDDIKGMKIRRPRVGRKKARTIEKFTSNILDSVMYEMLNKTLVYNPTKRLSADEVLALPFYDAVRMRPPLKRSNGGSVPEIIVTYLQKKLAERLGNSREAH
ncbi:unnamed protein product [Caenorhabditis auriculariae]|uniref:Protein kinase domain-containing protein n=1 Tax=Caenorhabditis auriculariae TaxID=2777116 RepID=A0A8S1HCR7_9PELO|nr:unnamed protein product [Caenorhabditis auriculariae]